MLKRDEWLDLARKLDWELSYVSEKEAFPGGAERAALAAARRVGGLGRALPHHATPSTSPASTRRRRRSRRARGGRAASRTTRSSPPGWLNGAEAARGDAAAGRVRGGRRQPARRALRARQRLAHDGDCSARSTSCATRRSRSLLMHELVRWDAQFDWTHKLLPHRTTGSRSPRATSSTSCCSASDADRVRDRDELRLRDRVHQPAVRRPVGAGARRRRQDVREDGEQHPERRGAPRPDRRARAARPS